MMRAWTREELIKMGRLDPASSAPIVTSWTPILIAAVLVLVVWRLMK